MWVLIAGITVFLGIHSVRMVAPKWRENWIDTRGDGSWKGLYTVASFLGLGLIIWGVGLARQETWFIYFGPDWFVPVAMLLMLLALILLAAGNLPAGHLKRITRHPMVTGVIVWSFAHLLVNGDFASLLLFGSFLVWSIWNRIVVGQRDPSQSGPAAVKFDVVAVVLGAGLWLALIMGLHGWLFGVEVIA